ncbi:hypothetical protein ACFP1C_00835 [Levilactobacillus fujinensis]|uniref:Uncharacterized protein n=1 Tax=Levilactobacillus fujinensis TaxID=2486024 RepID=A0ABW1TCG8_9LACO
MTVRTVTTKLMVFAALRLPGIPPTYCGGTPSAKGRIPARLKVVKFGCLPGRTTM